MFPVCSYEYVRLQSGMRPCCRVSRCFSVVVEWRGSLVPVFTSQTLCALFRGVHQKNKSASGFDIINMLMGFDKAEQRMKVWAVVADVSPSFVLSSLYVSSLEPGPDGETRQSSVWRRLREPQESLPQTAAVSGDGETKPQFCLFVRSSWMHLMMSVSPVVSLQLELDQLDTLVVKKAQGWGWGRSLFVVIRTGTTWGIQTTLEFLWWGLKPEVFHLLTHSLILYQETMSLTGGDTCVLEQCFRAADKLSDPWRWLHLLAPPSAMEPTSAQPDVCPHWDQCQHMSSSPAHISTNNVTEVFQSHTEI